MWWGKITPTLKDVHILISKPACYYLTRWKKFCLCRCDYIKGLEIRRVFWIVQVGAIQSQTSLKEWSRMSEQETDSKMLPWWFEDSGMGSWATEGSWLLESRKSKEAGLFPRATRRNTALLILRFLPSKIISDFWPPEPLDNKSVLFFIPYSW